MDNNFTFQHDRTWHGLMEMLLNCNDCSVTVFYILCIYILWFELLSQILVLKALIS